MTALYHFLSLLRVSFYTQPVCKSGWGRGLARKSIPLQNRPLNKNRARAENGAGASAPRFDLYIYEMISTQAAQKGGREAKTFLITEAAKAATRLLCIPHHESNTPRRRPNNECKQSQSSWNVCVGWEGGWVRNEAPPERQNMHRSFYTCQLVK